ncbi:hypothetical protein CHS0354_023790 [Potamilus streckersoni]|uniref:Cytochrome c domain-containing protein n=1 Tax=Potamilus streckersoni TaxID=2493646 RepID=A0AAE0RZ35_9BIVA|nr:hypothetical protein CHS0354_023790 [Potamilus streckersoni]
MIALQKATIRFVALYFFAIFLLIISTSCHRESEDLKKKASKKTQLKKKTNVASDKETILRGEKIFEKYCMQCHASGGTGQIGPNLTDDYWIRGATEEEITRTINEGVPDKGMVAFAEHLPEHEISDVIAYVVSLRGTNKIGKSAQGYLYKKIGDSYEKDKNAPFTVAEVEIPKDVPIISANGNVKRGKDLFNVVLGCAHCHGTDAYGHIDNRNIKEAKKRYSKNWLRVIDYVMFYGRSVHPTDEVYVTNEDGKSLSVIKDSETVSVKTIPIGKRPRGVKFSLDRKLLYVATSGSPKMPPWMSKEEKNSLITDPKADGIAEIDLQTLAVTNIFNAGTDPEQFDIARDGTRLFVANEDASTLSVFDLNKKKIIAEINVGNEPEGVRVSHIGNLVAVTCEEKGELFIIDCVDYSIVAEKEIGKRPRSVVFSPDDELLYVSSEGEGVIYELEVKTLLVNKTIKLPAGSAPVEMVMNKQGDKLFVANGRGKTVCEIDLLSKKVKRTVSIKDRPWSLALNQTETRLYTANGPSDDISIIDLETFTVLQNIKTDKGPWGIVVR